MSRDNWKFLMATKCLGDYKGQHCWITLGVAVFDRIFYRIYQCSQCRKIVQERLRSLK